jgi:hypothetical protein
MKTKEIQGTEKITTHKKLTEKPPRARCGPGSKSALATCVHAKALVAVPLRGSVSRSLGKAANYVRRMQGL